MRNEKPCGCNSSAKPTNGFLGLSLVAQPSPLGTLTKSEEAEVLKFANEAQKQFMPHTEAMTAQRINNKVVHAEVPNNCVSQDFQDLVTKANLSLRATYQFDDQAVCAELTPAAIETARVTGNAVKVSTPLQVGEFHFTVKNNSINALQFQFT